MTVDVRYDTVIRCDEPGCKRRFNLQTHWTYARKRAEAEGWSYADAPYYRDLCPDHKEEEEADE